MQKRVMYNESDVGAHEERFTSIGGLEKISHHLKVPSVKIGLFTGRGPNLFA